MSVPASQFESVPAVSSIARRADRRRVFLDFLAGVARARDDVAAMRVAFEEGLGRVVSARRIALRQANERQRPGRRDGLVIAIPDRRPNLGGALDVELDRGVETSAWDRQMLGMAGHIGSLVLEIERLRSPQSRTAARMAARAEVEAEASPIIGTTPAVRALRATIERVAGTDFGVLLEGESGSGKELVAREIHATSRRRRGPFVAINCAALVETLVEAELFGIEERTATGVRGRRGKFEQADGGTLFLDEVSDLSPAAQAKLLRALQDLAVERVGGNVTHAVDIRVIAATNRGLADLVERRQFRADLFYRLSGVDIRVPALRERRADIPVLAAHFLERHRATRSLGLSPAAIDVLVAYDWPGNVRELQRVMERAVALAERDVIDPDDLPAFVRKDYAETYAPSLTRNETLRVWAGRYVRLVLDRCGGNKRQACRVLDISYHTLRSYLQLPVATAEQTPVDVLHDAVLEEGRSEDMVSERVVAAPRIDDVFALKADA